VTLLLRLISAGGWLAAMLNQASGFSANLEHDQSAKPRMVVVWIAGFLVAGTGFALDTARRGSTVEALLALACFGLALLTSAGWALGTVPFTPRRDEPPPEGPGLLAPPEGLRVRVTGTVEDVEGKLRAYRHRPATLTGSRLVVHGPDGPEAPSRVLVAPDLGRGIIENLERGTAWLVTGAKPAIRIARRRSLGAPGPDSAKAGRRGAREGKDPRPSPMQTVVGRIRVPAVGRQPANAAAGSLTVLLGFDDEAERDRVWALMANGNWPERTPLRADEEDDGTAD
jgi:hypothetical protein